MEDDDSTYDYKSTPIYQKAREIAMLAHRLIDIIDDDENELLIPIKEFMREDAFMIPAKIARGSSGYYDSQMESAALVRKACRDLLTHCHSLEMFGFPEKEYLDLIRTEIEEFRKLFVTWVEGFNRHRYFVDRWGLFNPPGVGPHDEDREENYEDD